MADVGGAAVGCRFANPNFESGSMGFFDKVGKKGVPVNIGCRH